MRVSWLSMVPILSLSALLFAAEPVTQAPPVTEMDLDRAQLLVQEGDTHAGLLTALRVLCEGADEELRGRARGMLQAWGFTAQELLTVDPAVMKPDDLNALCERAAKSQMVHRRNELEINFCVRLVHAAVRVGRGPDGHFSAAVNEADLARALNGLIQIALAAPPSETTEEAQRHLERMNCVGAKLEAVRKAAAEGKLPAELKNEIIAADCLHRLQQYREWLESEENEGEAQMRKAVARQLGMALFQYCEKNLQATAAFRRETETVGYWRTAAQVPANF